MFVENVAMNTVALVILCAAVEVTYRSYTQSQITGVTASMYGAATWSVMFVRLTLRNTIATDISSSYIQLLVMHPFCKFV